MWYIFDEKNNCVSTAQNEPDKTDLESRNESTVESDLILAINQVTKDDSGEVIQKELTADQTKQQELNALDAEYQTQFDDLGSSMNIANLANNTNLITELQTEYVSLKSEYQTKRSAIENGN